MPDGKKKPVVVYLSGSDDSDDEDTPKVPAVAGKKKAKEGKVPTPGNEENAGAADGDEPETVDVWYEKCVVCSKGPEKLNGRKALLNTWCSLACAEQWLAKGGDEGCKLLDKYAKEKREKWKDKTFSKRETKLLERFELFKDLLKRQSQWNQKIFLAAAVVTLVMTALDFSFVFPPIDFVIYWAICGISAVVVYPSPDEIVPGEGTYGKVRHQNDEEDELDSELIAGKWVKKKGVKKRKAASTKTKAK